MISAWCHTRSHSHTPRKANLRTYETLWNSQTQSNYVDIFWHWSLNGVASRITRQPTGLVGCGRLWDGFVAQGNKWQKTIRTCHKMHAILCTKQLSERQSMSRFKMALCRPKWTFAWGLLQSSLINGFCKSYSAYSCESFYCVSMQRKLGCVNLCRIHQYTT